MIIIGVVLVISAFFLFFRLGHYGLWDDEAGTALYAQSVWQTGDTYALLDHNLIAHNSGAELKDLHNRYIPPLGFYLAAPFVGLGEGSAFAARLPFALCGLLTVALMLFWLWRANASLSTWLLTSAGILGNVSLMLYARQCRYYSPAILFTTILAFLYCYRDQRKRTLLSISLVSILLLASNYLCYAAVYACLAVDYLLWGRRTRPIRHSDLAIIFGPQLVLGGLLTSVYNPLGKDIWHLTTTSWMSDKVTLFLWNLRELNSCELGVGLLILIAPFLYRFTKEERLLRCSMAIFTYIFVIALLSPQPIQLLSVAFVRYLAPLIPLCIFTATLSIQALTVRSKWLAVILAALAFGTNVLHGGPAVGIDRATGFSRIIAEGRFRSTVVNFTRELISPPPSAYRATADWINQNLKGKESIWVVPSFATYPLMYHAPKATYAWQLKEKTGQFKELPDIHFMNKTLPDYVIVFGPGIDEIRGVLKNMSGRYIQIEVIDQYWYDLTRPELFWHSFQEIRNFSPTSEAIYIFKRVSKSSDVT